MLNLARDGMAPGRPLVRRLCDLGLAWTAAAVMASVAAGPTLAQSSKLENAGSANTLQLLSGQNAAQQQMGVSIDEVCPTLVVNRSSLDADGQDLADVCTRMVQSANEVREIGGTDNSYGLSESELNGVLQQINGEEITAPREHLAEVRSSQATAVGGRLAALREGTRGASVGISGLDPLTARQFALGHGFADTQLAADEDQFSNLVPDWGVFLIGNFNFGDRDPTPTAEGFDFDAYGATGGFDYRFADNLIGGLAVGFNAFDADFDTSLSSASGQELSSWAYSISGYGTYYIGESFYLEGVATYSRVNYDSERRIVINSNTGQPSENRTAEGDFNANQFSISGGAGYQHSVEGFDITPYVRGSYIHADIGSYDESGAGGLNLSFGDQDVDSLTSTLRLQVSKAVSTDFGVLLPTLWGEWIHEFLNNNDGATVSYLNDPTGLSTFTAATDDPDRDYFQVGVGLVAALPGGWSPFANYQTLLGLEDLTSHLFTIGLRKEL